MAGISCFSAGIAICGSGANVWRVPSEWTGGFALGLLLEYVSKYLQSRFFKRVYGNRPAPLKVIPMRRRRGCGSRLVS
jgi:hypothetical protein